MEQTIFNLVGTQIPVLAALIWFLIYTTREHTKQMNALSVQFQSALDKVVDKIGDRLDRIESKIEQSDLINKSGIING
ncbi:MAG: hypothetical protein LBT89_02110 [Planctomycetaceae bacterium]|jgi:hypothetical protein|nr:hypothetical protein [Planctomycetaceae bacterium]